jgi:hypothetical protein
LSSLCQREGSQPPAAHSHPQAGDVGKRFRGKKHCTIIGKALMSLANGGNIVPSAADLE